MTTKPVLEDPPPVATRTPRHLGTSAGRMHSGLAATRAARARAAPDPRMPSGG